MGTFPYVSLFRNAFSSALVGSGAFLAKAASRAFSLRKSRSPGLSARPALACGGSG